MRGVMGNLLETDSDVASISDSERERTDGDGMESEAMLDVNKNASSSLDPRQSNTALEPILDDNGGQLCGDGENTNLGSPRLSSHGSFSAVQPSTSGLRTSRLLPDINLVSLSNLKSESSASVGVLFGKTKTVSPRELPPRNQLIQLKPTMCKPKINTRNSTESAPEGISKQKNPRFIPYEPYRGAVRPMVVQDVTAKKHSRTVSEVSASSSSVEHTIGNLSLNDNSVDEIPPVCSSSMENFNDNTQHKSLEGRQSLNTRVVDAQYLKQENVIEKQTHALILLKERLKIAEKDNDELHKENVRLKKLLVDSLSGDILQGRTDIGPEHSSGISSATNESVDTLSNEIEVWRSKFLSSCVLVEQLTRENGTLNEAVAVAANIFKDIKLTSSLSPAHFEQVNTWLKANRPSFSTVASSENNDTSDL